VASPQKVVEFKKELDVYMARNPDADVSAMLGTYAACKGKNPSSIAVVREHIDSCEWCRKYLAGRLESKKLATNEHGWWDGRWEQ